MTTDDEPEPPLIPGWLRVTHLETGRDIHLSVAAVRYVKLSTRAERESVHDSGKPATAVGIGGGKQFKVKESISVVLQRLGAAHELELAHQAKRFTETLQPLLGHGEEDEDVGLLLKPQFGRMPPFGDEDD